MGVYLQEGSDFWYLDYYDSRGERQRTCSNTKNKTEAKLQLAETLVQVSHKKKGLKVHTKNLRITLGDAWKRWLEEWCPEASNYSEWGRYRSNILNTELGGTEFDDITSDMLEKWFKAKLVGGPDERDPTRIRKPQNARTVNGHRRIMRRVFNCFIEKQLWKGLNPVKGTKALDEPYRPYDMLTEQEFLRVAAHLPESTRVISLVSYYTGLRRGEVYALRKLPHVVDLELATLTPQASNQYNRVKGKTVKVIPLMPEALALFKEAWLKTMHGELLFPWKDGGMRNKNQKPSEVIRTALKKAGMVEYWAHVCRWGCKVRGQQLTQKHNDEQQRDCPLCKRILYPKAIVRKVRFHDLRHSILNNMLNDGAPIHAVSKFARHASIDFTDKKYIHQGAEQVRRDIAPKALDARLADLARGQSPEVVAVLAEAQAKLTAALENENNRSYIGHTTKKIVSIQSLKRAKS